MKLLTYLNSLLFCFGVGFSLQALAQAKSSAEQSQAKSSSPAVNCETAYSDAQAAFNECEAKHASAVKVCENVQMTGQMMGLATQAAQAIGSNDQKKLCDTALALSVLVGGANTGFGLACGHAANSCIKECSAQDSTERAAQLCRAASLGAGECAGDTTGICKTNARVTLSDVNTLKGKITGYKSDCDSQKGTSKMAYVQAAMNAITAAQSLDCKKRAEADACDTIADIKKSPVCYMRLCAPGGQFYGTEECSPINVDCTADANFGNPVCVCKSNPQDPVCPGNAGGNGIGGAGGIDGGSAGGSNGLNGAAGGNSVDGGFTDQDLAGVIQPDGSGGDPFANRNEKGGAGAGGGQPGAPFSPGGGYSGNPGGNGSKGGASRGAYNTDILQGPAGGGGYSAGGGSGSYPFGSAGNSKTGKDGINLRDFLPGGKRGIAGQKELEKNGVSNAEGPTNFEKVTRQVNQLRRTNQTIETK